MSAEGRWAPSSGSGWCLVLCDSPFLPPRTRVPGERYYLNLTSHFRHTELRVSLSLYMSLCQYFSEEKMMWSTDGLVPLEETSPSQAVCLTRHLTAFGASLLVPPSRVHFTLPVSGDGQAEVGPGLHLQIILQI